MFPDPRQDIGRQPALAESALGFNMGTAVARKNNIVQGIIHGIHGALKRQDAITFIKGPARFVDPHEIDTGESRLTARTIIIATGARRAVPAIEGLDEAEYLTNRSALELDHVPSSIVVVGGGYVGIEFAQMLSRCGSRVTLLGRNDQIASGEDAELSTLLADMLRDEGIAVHTGVTVRKVHRSNGPYRITSTGFDGEQQFEADDLLLATGRVGNTDDLGLSAAGIAIRKREFIPTNDQLQSNQSHIFAIGDVKGGWMFTHVATYDGPIAAHNAVSTASRTVAYRVVPRAIFSDPTLAAVGLTETEARDRGHDVAVGWFPLSARVPWPSATREAVGNRWSTGQTGKSWASTSSRPMATICSTRRWPLCTGAVGSTVSVHRFPCIRLSARWLSRQHEPRGNQ